MPGAELKLPGHSDQGGTGFADRYAAARPLHYAAASDKLNHNVFRYPAKFHPPVARSLIELVTDEGQTVLDPFCGSGTLLVEAAALGRNAIGSDIDPLAVFVARAKTVLTDARAVSASADACLAWLDARRTEDLDRWGPFTNDVDEATFRERQIPLASSIPDLPNMNHWFRRRSVLQLADIRRYIQSNNSGQGRQFLELCFASIIRNSSNADPVPVSGLEVTSHMLAKEKEGRSVDPWKLMARAIAKSLAATRSFLEARRDGCRASVLEADARHLTETVTGKVDAIITSPPYLTAVDYYRRHTLEMYWLGLVDQRAARLALMGRYIGRDRIGTNHFSTEGAFAAQVADRWLTRFPAMKPERERAFRHYCDGMARSLARMVAVVPPGAPVVIVAGDVRFCGIHVSMLELMKDLAGERVLIADHLWYPILNRYMSYTRRNEANIAADHVLVFRSVQ